MNSSEVGGIANSSSSFRCPFEDTDLSFALKILTIFFAGGFGILNNIFIIVLALKYTTKRNLHHLIINMAVGDALSVLGLFGLFVPSIVEGINWGLFKRASGDLVCKIFSFCYFCPMLASYSSLAIISIERFRVSRQTIYISKPYTLKQRLVVVACSWMIAAALASHQTPYRAIEEGLMGDYGCRGISQIPISLTVIFQTFFIVSFSGVTILSFVTLRNIYYRNEIERNLSESQREARRKKISDAVKMILSSLLLFMSCYSPAVIWILVKLFVKNSFGANILHCYDLYIFDFLTTLLSLLNTCCAPCIYLTFLSNFRKAARNLICKRTSNGVGP